jgi:hypothetical protein
VVVVADVDVVVAVTVWMSSLVEGGVGEGLCKGGASESCFGLEGGLEGVWEWNAFGISSAAVITVVVVVEVGFGFKMKLVSSTRFCSRRQRLIHFGETTNTLSTRF